MSERDTIVKNLNEWASKLVAFDEAEKAEEVYVWLLRDGKVERVKVDAPDFMEQCLRENREYIFAPYCELIIHTKDEGVTWFRSEAGAEVRIAYNEVLKRDKAEEAKKREANEEPDDLISLRAAKAWLRLNRVEVPYTKSTLHLAGQARRHNETVDELILALGRLSRYPIQDKMVPWAKVEEWLLGKGFRVTTNNLREYLEAVHWL